MPRLLILLFCLISPCLSYGEGMLGSLISDSTLNNIVEPGRFKPLPLASSSYWREALPNDLRAGYIALGEQHLNEPWPTLNATLFAENKLNGNRVRYEAACFAKRRMLAELVMAEVAEGKGRFLDAITDGLWSHLEETWWGIPAHYSTAYPIPSDQTVDLFNAETASMIAWTSYILADSLDARSPLIRKRVDEEITRRILIPALSTNYWWKRAGMNWNPWICSNWLACALICEHDRNRQLSAIRQIADALDHFIDSYPDDGGCDEGPGYWDRAAASLYEALNLLSLASNGAIDLSQNAKIHAMGSYAYKTYIQDGYCTNFADSHDNKSLLQVNILYPFGLYLRDNVMRSFAKYLWQGPEKAGKVYAKSGNFPTLGRELFFLSHFSQFDTEEALEPQLPNVWLPHLQVMAARDKSGLYVAMKGGHNDESHNHNDVGSFIVYANGSPVLIDPGVGEYTAKTFGASRYEIWTMQSGYHNLPQINGHDQQQGKTYAARAVNYKKGRLTMDLAGAYPEDAHVKEWLRTVSLHANSVEVDERYELSAITGETSIMLMTTLEPKQEKGRILLGSRHVVYNPSQLEADVEDISMLLDPLLKEVWGERMFRIKLKVKGNETRGHLRYRIE